MVFCVPLREGDRFATGVIGRVAPAGRILLGYFFEPARDALLDLREASGLGPANAIYVALLGDPGFADGSWPVIGPMPGWRKKDWPMPEFCRPVDGDRAFLAVSYKSDDVSADGAVRPISQEECGRLPEDGLAGSGFVELRLTRLLTAS